MVTEMLRALSSERVAAAWTEFLARYSPLIMHVIRQHGVDDDRAAECFIHVCAALSDDGFRRLRGFRPDGPAKFKTWLQAVVANLCVDWRRTEQGRSRPPRCIAHLPDLEQQIFRCIYVRAMSRTECLRVLLPKFPELTEKQVAEVNGRIFALLTPQQRWQLSTRKHRPASVVREAGSQEKDPFDQLLDPASGPDELTDGMLELRLLHDALARLPVEQRLLLRLRYEQDLTLAEVARLTRQPDPFRANRLIHGALEALAGLMGVHRSRSARKDR